MKITFKPHQRYVIHEIIKDFDDYNNFFINLPTGGGKTAIALEVARQLIYEYKYEGIVYVTRTINEYSPVLRDIRKFEFPLTVCGLIGKSRLCDFEWKWLFEELEGEVDICKVCPKRTAICTYFNIDKFIEKQSIIEALNEIPKYYCKYRTLIAYARLADVLLVTLPYLLRRPRKMLEHIYDVNILIIDEAHNVENLNQYVSISLRRDDLQILRESGFNVNDLLGFVDKVRTEGRELKFVDKNAFKNEVPELDSRIWEEYRKILQHHLNGTVKYAKAILRTVRFYSYVDEPYLDMFSYKYGLKLLVTDVRGLLQNAVAYKNIFMSGTLPPQDYIEKVWGLQGKYIDVEKKFKLFEKCRKYYWIKAVTSKYEFRNKFEEKMRQVLDMLLQIVPKVVLVVFPSYEYLERFKDLAKKYNAVVEDERTRIEKVQEEILSGSKDVVFAVAGGKLTEGIELVKEGKSVIKTIILAGVPYPTPDDYNKRKAQKIVETLGFKGGDVVFRYTVHIPALILTKQAIGRGIRFEHDFNNVFFLDWRFKFFFEELGIEKVYLVKL